MKKVLLFIFILSIMGIIAFIGFKVSSPTIYFDGASIIVIIVFTLLPLIWSSSLKDVGIGFSLIMRKDVSYTIEQLKNADAVYDMIKKSLVLSAVFATIIGIIALLSQLGDMSTFGPTLAVILLTILYASILMAFVLPIQLTIKKAIHMYHN